MKSPLGWKGHCIWYVTRGREGGKGGEGEEEREGREGRERREGRGGEGRGGEGGRGGRERREGGGREGGRRGMIIKKKYVDSNGHIDVIVFLNNKTIDQHIYHVVTLKWLVNYKRAQFHD